MGIGSRQYPFIVPAPNTHLLGAGMTDGIIDRTHSRIYIYTHTINGYWEQAQGGSISEGFQVVLHDALFGICGVLAGVSK